MFLSVNSAILKKHVIHTKTLISNSGRTFIAVVKGEQIVWVQFTQMAGSRTNALGWNAWYQPITIHLMYSKLTLFQIEFKIPLI